MEILTTQTFKAKVFDFTKNRSWQFEGPRPALVDFYADWCGPCKALSPILENLSREYAGKIDVYKVNTETHPELASLFSVRGIPALLFIPKHGPPTMSAGFMPQSSIKEAIKDILNVY